MDLRILNKSYVYDNFKSGQKIFYKLVPIPFLDLPKELQNKIRKIEDLEGN
jgi:hypothetical protein